MQEVDSDADEDEDEDDEVEDADAMDVDDDEDDDEVDAEGDEDDDMDAEGDDDDDMDGDTPAPRIVVSAHRSVPVKPAISITKAQDSVEAKEMAMDDDDDDELSDPESDLDGDDDDAEGEEDDELAAQNDDEDMDMDSDEGMSRGQTPDMSKMTKRQRAMVNEDSDGALMALSNEAQKKKHLTAEEHAMRRAEMARRRKNLSEKRNEEEKVGLTRHPPPCTLISEQVLTCHSSTPSTVCSRNSLPSAAVVSFKTSPSLAKKKNPSRRGPIRCLSATCRMTRAHR